jgi:hypothetical protein
MRSSNVRIRFEDPNRPGEISLSQSGGYPHDTWRIETPGYQIYDLPESGLRALATAIAVALDEQPQPGSESNKILVRTLEKTLEALTPKPAPLPSIQQESLDWAVRASRVQRELANYKISCRAQRSRVSGVTFASFENPYDIKAEASDGGLLSFWRVDAQEGHFAGDAPSFETAVIACGEQIFELLEARATTAEAALAEKA